ncbi:MAG TPA: hypothetical protein VND89_08440 [Acidimicrobiales bacterium]|nr:hypothetical protein [Acidimicrobiales bacterium]
MVANLGLLTVVAMVISLLLPTDLASASRVIDHQQKSNAPFSVGVARCTFTDTSRKLGNYSTTPPSVLSNVRTLVTEIRYPTKSIAGGSSEIKGAKPAPQVGGYPMIVFAHGYDVTPDTYAPLLDAWVRAGFVVAAPFFPDESAAAVSAQHGANTEDDVLNEPADLAFVTRSILESSANETSRCPVVSGMVNATELGLVGHSDGATAVGLLTLAHGNDPQGISYASLRAGLNYRAVAILSGEEDTVDSYASEASDPALLVVQSAADQCNPIRVGVKLYDDIHQTNKWFLELRTAHHLPPFDGVNVPAFRVVASTSTRFFRMNLDGATPTEDLTVYGNQRPSVAVMFGGEVRPTVFKASHIPATCGPN